MQEDNILYNTDKNMDNTLLRQVQLIELEILCEIDRICREENIKYYIFYGTLLGAVRHQGFIPWDDDIDIVLLREDYDKLMEVLSKKLSKDYWLQNYETDSDYWLPFAKVRKKGTVYREKNTKNIPDEKSGIWVDIFPLDNVKKDNSWLRIESFIINNIALALRQRELDLKIINFSKREIPFIVFLKMFSKNKLKMFQDRLMQKNNKKQTSLCAYMLEPKKVFEKILLETKEIQFENKSFYAPKEIDKVLKQCYGDYMKLPPENERHAHIPEEIKL